jgi:purine-binding chemotaxis protein CheW
MNNHSELEKTVTKKEIPHAIVRFQNDYFGVALDHVREFTEIKNLFPIPCCPAHIIGNTNLRGEIVTVVDIRPWLEVAIEPVTVGSRMMVVSIGDLVVGLPISAVVDTVYVSPRTLPQTPIDGGRFAYLQGMISYREKSLSLLDLPLLMNQKSLVVEEKV